MGDRTDKIKQYSPAVLIKDGDENEIDQLKTKYKESVQFLIFTIIFLCLWVFLVMAWKYFGEPFSVQYITHTLLFCSVIILIPVRKQAFNRENLGLSTNNLWKNILAGIGLTILGFCLLSVIKMIIIHFNPSAFSTNKAFFDFSWVTPWEIMYPFSAIWQEFVARGILHGNLRRIIPKPYNEPVALFVSSIFFGAVHLHVGFIYMIGASILLGCLGALYIKQGSIWGTCIPHYFLGVSICILGFV